MFTFNFYLFICFKLMEQRIVILKKHFVKILKQFSFGVFFFVSFVLSWFLLLFETGSCYVTQAGLELSNFPASAS
jgi:hypothetical protein